MNILAMPLRLSVRLFVLVLLALLAVFLVLPVRAFAAGVGTDPSTHAILIVSPAWQLAISAVIPIVVGIVTRCTLPVAVKGGLTLILNAVATLVLTATMTSAALITQQALLQWLLGVLTSLAAYYSILKPAGLHSNPGGALAPDAGIGPKTVGGK